MFPIIDKGPFGLILRTLLWSIAGFTVWLLGASWYENLLGDIAWHFFPREDVFLYLKNHVFSIGLTEPGRSSLPQLTFNSHNSGFGFIVTGAIILGSRHRSWSLRIMGLVTSWFLLLITHICLLVLAVQTYSLAMAKPDSILPFSIFVKSVHPTITLVPIIITIVWLMTSLQKTR